MNEQTYTTREAAELLGIKPNSLLAAMRDGRINPAEPNALRWMFTRAEIERYDAYRKASRGGDTRTAAATEARGSAGRAIRTVGAKLGIYPERLPVVGSGAKVTPRWQRDAMDLEREMRRMMRGMR